MKCKIKVLEKMYKSCYQIENSKFTYNNSYKYKKSV